ncbi:MAG: GTPase/DUF3482 domain-containing protein [Oceanobacter sp.]
MSALSDKQPVFAVVGHPNRGKSCIVATLTRQDAVRISEISGTTTESQAFHLTLGGQRQYELVDTPGFQRPRQVLSWLQKQATHAGERVASVEAFLAEYTAKQPPRFVDEVELLTPIMQGAGIIYVVDGSLPYSPEYEAEMTILQWTGQPRMALINPIGGEAFVSEWQAALSQYFGVVRVFDPMTADEGKQRAVLSAFAELYEPWRVPLEQTLKALDQHQQHLEQQGVCLMVERLVAMLSYTHEIRVPVDALEPALRKQLKREYQQTLRDMERRTRRELQALFAHTQLQTESTALQTDYPDLFDQDAWYLFGLSRQKLIVLSASAGAAAGAVLDAGVGGASFMTGALAGGVVSGLASIAATLKPEKLKIRGVPVAGKSLVAGPVKELPFAFALLGRLLDFLALLQCRTHADRSTAQLQDRGMGERLERLPRMDQVKLTRLIQKAHKGLSDKEQRQLCEYITWMLADSEERRRSL